MGLGDIRWFECFRDRDQLDQAEASIRAGAGVPYRMVDRGCGARAAARALGGE